MKTFEKISFNMTIVILITTFSSIRNYPLEAQAVHYTNPAWAPAYYPGVRYYYIPDIETFYDLSNQDFVYLDNGQWIFSYDLPAIYSGFDLFGAFIVALNVDVFQPWMHFQFYLSNYPRYYYRSYYKEAEIRNIRGFNENGEKPVFWTQEERNRASNLSNNAKAERRSENSRPPQNPNYYGRNIGRPVKVQPQMRENRQTHQGQRRR